MIMQKADDKFDRQQPRWMEYIPFAIDDSNSLPSLAESIGWIVIGGLFISLCFGFLVA